MEISNVPCVVCALEEENRIIEFHLEPIGEKSILNNIYVGKVETISPNIGAAFVRFSEGQNGFFPLAETVHTIFTGSHAQNKTLRQGDEILVQVNRDAMKGKLPALTADLNLPGRFFVLTTADKKLGMSSKLSVDEKKCLYKWLEEADYDFENPAFGLIVRTNASEASKEEFLMEYQYLQKLYQKITVSGKNRTCYSLLYENPASYLNLLRDQYAKNLEEVVTDISVIYETVLGYLQDFSPEETGKVRFYQDSLLPLYKLYQLEGIIDEIYHEKIWLKSGGFLMIQQTEAFVSIDVNSGKYTDKKKAEEAYRKINLEAAKEIARQLRLRNLSGIILIDFINMKNPDHQDELFHVLQKHLRKDPVKSKAVDITPLHILEMTRKKVRRPVIEDLRNLNDRETS